MPLYTANGIVLRRISFGETDRIVTLYTRELGKISAIAKGARKPISRLSGATETLTHAYFQLATGKTLDVITQAEARDSFPRIKKDISRITCASYVAELVDKFVEERERNVRLFELILSTLYLLERPNDPLKIVRMFELKFMSLMGYEPSLDKCIRCQAESSSEGVSFSPSLGGLVCSQCGPCPEDAIELSHETIETMRALVSADAPQVEAMAVAPNTLDEVGKAMKWYIRYRAPGEIKSLNFLHLLRK